MAHGSQTIATDQGDLHVLNNGDGSVDIDINPTDPEKLCIYVNGEPWGPIQPTAKPEEAPGHRPQEESFSASGY